MHLGSSIAAAALTFLGLIGDPSSTDPGSSVMITSDDPAWTQRVEWAIDRMQTVGLEVPAALTVEVHADTAACNGESGLYRPGPEVHLCSSSGPDSTPGKLITLHELAHAWAETALGEDQRADLLRVRGLEAWTDPAIPRWEWGAEHAAEIISWGLMDAEVQIVRINDAGPDELLPAFELLAGRPPLWR